MGFKSVVGNFEKMAETYALPTCIFLQDGEFESFAVGVLRVPRVFRDPVLEAQHVVFPFV